MTKMSSPEIPQKAKDLCVKLEKLAEDRSFILAACRTLNQVADRIQVQQEEIEQDLMDMLNTGDFEILDIGRLRLVFQPEDKYNTRPWFEVRYPDYTGVYTKRHFLRKPGNKRKKGKS